MFLTVFYKAPGRCCASPLYSIRYKSYKRQKEGKGTFYCEAVNYFLKMCATADVIAETDPKMISFTQPLNEKPKEYAEDLWKNDASIWQSI